MMFVFTTSHLLQKRMKETECTLADLEAKYMKANNTIKEKQYLIENLLKSG
jgi:kinesin family protein 11